MDSGGGTSWQTKYLSEMGSGQSFDTWSASIRKGKNLTLKENLPELQWERRWVASPKSRKIKVLLSCHLPLRQGQTCCKGIGWKRERSSDVSLEKLQQRLSRSMKERKRWRGCGKERRKNRLGWGWKVVGFHYRMSLLAFLRSWC